MGLGLLGACGGSSSSKPSEPGHPQSAAELAASFTDAVCSARNNCCTEQDIDFDLEDCKAQLGPDIEDEFSEFEGLRVVFDPDAAASCIAGWANVFCPHEPIVSDPKDACDHVFRGLQQLGQPCEREAECAETDGHWPACALGKCTAVNEPVRPREGDACGGTCLASAPDFDECEAPRYEPSDLPVSDPGAPLCRTEDGLGCWSSADGPSTCQPLAKVGESCAGNSHHCDQDGFCNVETGLCEARHDSGECNPQASVCTTDTVCDPERLECVPRLLGYGEACEADAECASDRCRPTGTCGVTLTAEQCEATTRF